MKEPLLRTTFGEQDIAFVTENITAIQKDTDTTTNVWVRGSDDSFVVSEPFAIFASKLDCCLQGDGP